MSVLDVSVRCPEADNDAAYASYTKPFTFTVSNREVIPVVFKVMTQRPGDYAFAPSLGLVPPHTEMTVSVRLVTPDYYARLLHDNKDLGTIVALSPAVASAAAASGSGGSGNHSGSRRASSSLAAADDGATASEGSSSDDGGAEDGGGPEGRGSGRWRRRRGSREDTHGTRHFLKTRISSALFKVELRICGGNVGWAVPETRYLSRQATLRQLATSELEAAALEHFRRRQQRSRSGSRLRHSTNSTTSNGTGGGGALQNDSIASNESMDSSASAAAARADGFVFVPPSPEDLAGVCETIRASAAALFDHLWMYATPHSTHTICCRTLRESLKAFYTYVGAEQQRAAAGLEQDRRTLLEERPGRAALLHSLEQAVRVAEVRAALGSPQKHHHHGNHKPSNGPGSAAAAAGSGGEADASLRADEAEIIEYLLDVEDDYNYTHNVFDADGSIRGSKRVRRRIKPALHFAAPLAVAAWLAAFVSAILL